MLSKDINIPQKKELTEILTCTLPKQVGQNNLFPCLSSLQWASTVPGASDVCGKGGRGDQLERYVGGLR